MITIAYYTDDDIYAEHAELLARSLDRFGISYDFEKIDKTSWEQATAFKPDFILSKLKQYNQPLLYIDIDSIVHNDYSDYFSSLACDVCIHYTSKGELLSGTIFFNNTQRSVNLLEQWQRDMLKMPDRWDQKVLQEIISSKIIEDLDVEQLSSKYVFIFDKDISEQDNVQFPVIEHLQASREVGYRKRQKKLKYKVLGWIGIRPSKGTRLMRRIRRMNELRESNKKK